MKIARISKGIFGKSQCNTEMSTVIPINLNRGTTFRTLYKVHSINLIETSKCGGTSRILQESFKLTK